MLRKTARMALICFALSTPCQGAWAAGKVYSPHVEKGELEIENRGTRTDDGDFKMKTGVGYGVTDFWFSEVYAETSRASGDSLDLSAVEFENIFQLSPTGKYLADFGFIAEYAVATKDDELDEFEFGPLVEKQLGPTVHTANLIFVKEIGSGAAGLELEYAWASRWRLAPYFEPGVEAFGALGELEDTGPLKEQEHQIGPAIIGTIPLNFGPGKLHYETGYYFGLTDATPDGEFRWLLEYEVRF